MKTIPVAVCGDDWVNQQSVLDQLQQDTTQDPLVLDLRAEGPSLHALGIVDVFLAHAQHTGKSIDNIYIQNWSNAVETVPFPRVNRHILSHFFWLSDRYRDFVPTNRTPEKLFGYFVGRRTVPRCVMLKHLQGKYPTYFLLSLMNTVAGFKHSELDPLDQWCDADEFNQWYQHQSIPSLDNHLVRDQYSENCNTNASLLRWYSKFDIELVAETYCHGDTFFVTEKTVRPIVAGKSMLIYGPANYLARLRNLGFQTWSTVWDEGYDQLTGPSRWYAMQSVIADLVSRNQEQLYQQCQLIVEHNQQHAQVLINRYRPG